MRNEMLARVSVKALVTSLMVISLAGCGAHPTISLKAAQGMSDKDVAILRRDPNDAVANGYSFRSFLNAVYDLEGQQVMLKSEGFGDYLEVKVPPGVYAVQLKTYGSQTAPAFPNIRMAAKAGHIYYFRGVPIMDKAAVRVEYREEITTLDANGKALPPPLPKP